MKNSQCEFQNAFWAKCGSECGQYSPLNSFHLPHVSYCFTFRLMLISTHTIIYLPPYTVATPDATVVVSHRAASSVDSIADYNGFNTVVCRAARVRCRHGVPSCLLTHNNGPATGGYTLHDFTIGRITDNSVWSANIIWFHNQMHARSDKKIMQDHTDIVSPPRTNNNKDDFLVNNILLPGKFYKHKSKYLNVKPTFSAFYN